MRNYQIYKGIRRTSSLELLDHMLYWLLILTCSTSKQELSWNLDMQEGSDAVTVGLGAAAAAGLGILAFSEVRL